ncbi:MAG: ABC transporter ATP-binding protein [Zavarzinella sp.]
MITARNLHKSYFRHKTEVPVLKGIDLTVDRGEFVAIVGSSGSGKSTLLHLMGTLDAPTRGEVFLNDQRIDHLPARDKDRLRNSQFGFIFQFYHLLPELTALQNVMMPAMVSSSFWQWRGRKSAARKRAIELLELVGLGPRMHHKPKELSGGEMQRTAIARALASNPKVLFADEPTGNLDAQGGIEIVQLLRDINLNEGVTILMVTHNLELVSFADRVVRMVSGKLVDELVPTVAENCV